MYANGQSVNRDYVWAYAWLDLAAAQIQASALLRDKVAREMTTDEIGRARDLAARKRLELNQKEEPSR